MMFSQLSKREKYSVCIGGAFLFIFILLKLVVLPLADQRKTLQKNINIKTLQLKQMNDLYAEYESLKENGKRWEGVIARRPKQFKLISFMDALANKTNIKIGYIKPSRKPIKESRYILSKVELKLQEINIEELTNYLYQVETAEDMVFVKRISITKKGKEGYIEVVIQVETLET